MSLPLPQPASSTKHLSHLSHPLPRNLSVQLPLRQISSTSSAPSPASHSASHSASTPASTSPLTSALTSASTSTSTRTTTSTTTSSTSASTGTNTNTITAAGATNTAPTPTPNPPPTSSGAGVGSEIAGTGTTGTTLWLSAQILALYLCTLAPPRADTGAAEDPSDVDPSDSVPRARGSSSGSARQNHSHGQVLELGGGTGYISLVLSSLGWRVTTTDIEPVLSSVLRQNVAAGKRALTSASLPHEVRVEELDWVGVSAEWRAGEDKGSLPISKENGFGSGVGVGSDDGSGDEAAHRIDSGSGAGTGDGDGVRDEDGDESNAPAHDSADRRPGDRSTKSWITDTHWDMIVMTDTFYAPHLIDPLWETLLVVSGVQARGDDEGVKPSDRAVLHPQPQPRPKPQPQPQPSPHTHGQDKRKRKPPPIYIALERRDPRLIDLALKRGKEYGFDLRKVNRSRLAKEVEQRYRWTDEDWDGVEVWKCRYKR